jgi:hypothetical protein
MTLRTPCAVCLIAMAALIAAGCGIASAPIKDRPKIVATPRSGELTVAAQSGEAIGDVQPVYVSVANGTDTPRSLVPNQIFALDSAGNRIAPLPPGEAARQVGGEGKLKAALVSGAASGAMAGAMGAALGAIAGAVVGAPASGAAVGAAFGAGSGIISGVGAGQGESRVQATQIDALSLPGGEVRKDFTVSGYVFFPKGDYSDLEMLMVNSETGNTEVVKRPWH